MRVRRIVTGLAALSVVGAALNAATDSVPAWALVTGTGTVNCDVSTGATVSGTVKYTPAWSDSTTGAVTAKIKFTVEHCTGGNPTPVKIVGAGKVTFTPGANNCSEAEETGGDGTLKLTYGHGIAPSTYSGYIAPDPIGSFPYLWSEFGGNVVTGSYPNSQAVPPYSDPQFVITDASQTGNCTSGVRSVVLAGSGSSIDALNL